jgi:hypothetical protein
MLTAFTVLFSVWQCNTKPDPKQLLTGKWKVTALTLADNEMEADMLEDSYFEFSESGAFEEYVMGDNGKGTFKLLDDGSGFAVTYADEEHEGEKYLFKEMTGAKIVLTGEAHGMIRTIVLEKGK